MVYGYARVSTSLQDTRLQLDALKVAGVEVVFQEKTSSVGARPELQRLLSVLQSGDLLIVYKLDRIARSLRDLLTTLERIQSLDASFKSLTEPIDTSNPVGVFILQILGAVGQFERSLIRERAIAGQVAAYRRGVRWGGQPCVLSLEDAHNLVSCWSTHLFSIRLLADIFRCSESTVWRSIWSRSKPSAAKLKKLPVLSSYLD